MSHVPRLPSTSTASSTINNPHQNLGPFVNKSVKLQILTSRAASEGRLRKHSCSGPT